MQSIIIIVIIIILIVIISDNTAYSKKDKYDTNM